MAAVLLAVIITIEQWNGPAPRAGAPTLPKQSAAAVPEAGLPELAPAANATWTPPGIPEDTARHTAPETGGVVPASATVSDASWAARVDAVPSGTGWADAGESPATATAAGTANVTPIAPNAAGYADGVDVGTVPAAYPSTGRGPVLPDLPAPSAASPPPWPRPAGQPAVHRADRNPPGASYPTR
ncbi:MAG: hypothetical protein MUF48_08755 [Pirellulaceae bacterium]|jgi:hypothetical protein|nr:hypothetical protein [Pirellulaceae bacterium]